jgi:hypothetical protein
MPLSPELRHLRDADGELVYRGAAWQARRERLLARAGNKCERCRVPNGKVVERAHRDSWKHGEHWYSPDGFPPRAWRKVRTLRIVLTMAHLTHDPLRNDDEDLAMLCQWCHLNYDRHQHKETRQAHKDAARPLLECLFIDRYPSSADTAVQSALLESTAGVA